MFFDAHGDILTDVANELAKGNDIWENYHKKYYIQGKVNQGIFVNFTDPNSKNQRSEFEMITNLALPYFKGRQDFHIITKANDFTHDKFNLIFGIEGLNVVELDELEHLYQLGYRHLGITWNEQNQYASGSTQVGGATENAKKLVEKAEQLGMIIDYAHLNYESFMDVANFATKPILFSHGNVSTLCSHPRNLNDEQLLKLKDSNGVIGLAAMHFFLNEDKTKASITDLVDHVKYLIDLIGIDHIGFGFDFCFYLGDRNSCNKVEGLRNISDVNNLLELLKQAGLSDEDIEKISYLNMQRLVNECLNN